MSYRDGVREKRDTGQEFAGMQEKGKKIKGQMPRKDDRMKKIVS